MVETNGCAPPPLERLSRHRPICGCAAAFFDLYAPGMEHPVRCSTSFGDTLESIRSFDPETQRTIGQLRGLDLVPMGDCN